MAESMTWILYFNEHPVAEIYSVYLLVKTQGTGILTHANMTYTTCHSIKPCCCELERNGGFLKWGYPQSSSISDWDFHYKPTILEYPHDYGKPQD